MRYTSIILARKKITEDCLQILVDWYVLVVCTRNARCRDFVCIASVFYFCTSPCVGRDSSVGITTLYGLDVLRIESRWGRDFPHPFRSLLGPTQPSIQLVT
jgi:hypothetical protein